MPSASVDETEIITNIRDMLIHLGEDPDRPGMEKTPKRFLDALKFATSGYNQSFVRDCQRCVVPPRISRRTKHDHGEGYTDLQYV